MLLAGREVIQEVRPAVFQYLEHSNQAAVMGALFYATIIYVCEHSAPDTGAIDDNEVGEFVDDWCQEFDVLVQGRPWRWFRRWKKRR